MNRFTVRDFTYNKENNTFLCPNKKILIYKGFVKLNRNSGDKYQASPGGKTHMRTLYLAMIYYFIMAFYFCKFLFVKKGLFLQPGYVLVFSFYIMLQTVQ
ncbi:hypothetical protein TREAZ_2405 [Leadbettera azotonutricia ZAS-9]|uniref:Uncharacterized protein n=1 Tax=Leadbettera azotonutricia (strain ATCC BAA-888 / DSM 13862 / ZAS-9) TaxID=545695 RepID=F5YGB4_LEAAZ|nr:hypothetical protein TREAZ_2405 [Leadbettera azotonutricia ZAS-9]